MKTMTSNCKHPEPTLMQGSKVILRKELREALGKVESLDVSGYANVCFFSGIMTFEVKVHRQALKIIANPSKDGRISYTTNDVTNMQIKKCDRCECEVDRLTYNILNSTTIYTTDPTENITNEFCSSCQKEYKSLTDRFLKTKLIQINP